MLNFASDFTNTNTVEIPIEELWSNLQNKLLDVMNEPSTIM